MKSIQRPDAFVVKGRPGEFAVGHDLGACPYAPDGSEVQGQPSEVVSHRSCDTPRQLALVDPGGNAQWSRHVAAGMDHRVVAMQEIGDGFQRRSPRIRLGGGAIEPIHRPENVALPGHASLSNERSPFIIPSITSRLNRRHS
jgi:hypothetical protein